MKKIIYVIMVTLLIPYFAIMQPVSIDAKTTTYCGAYSNLVDAKSQKEVRKAMLDAGLSRKNVDAWLADVKTYNKTIKNTGLVKKGFKKMKRVHSMMKTKSWSFGARRMICLLDTIAESQLLIL